MVSLLIITCVAPDTRSCVFGGKGTEMHMEKGKPYTYYLVESTLLIYFQLFEMMTVILVPCASRNFCVKN